MGRQEEQVEAFGHHQFFAGMPASLIENQQDALGRAGADGLGELCQGNGEHIRSHRWQEQPFRLSRSRMHKTVEVEPLEAMLHRDTRACAFTHPDPAQDWFQSDPVLIGRPQFDRSMRKGLLHRF